MKRHNIWLRYQNMNKISLTTYILYVLSCNTSWQHLIPPLETCIVAETCNHTWLPVCGLDTTTSKKKLFLDICDMKEYNCDYKTEYTETNITECATVNGTQDLKGSHLRSIDEEVNITNNTTTTAFSREHGSYDTNIQSISVSTAVPYSSIAIPRVTIEGRLKSIKRKRGPGREYHKGDFAKSSLVLPFNFSKNGIHNNANRFARNLKHYLRRGNCTCQHCLHTSPMTPTTAISTTTPRATVTTNPTTTPTTTTQAEKQCTREKTQTTPASTLTTTIEITSTQAPPKSLTNVSTTVPTAMTNQSTTTEVTTIPSETVSHGAECTCHMHSTSAMTTTTKTEPTTTTGLTTTTEETTAPSETFHARECTCHMHSTSAMTTTTITEPTTTTEVTTALSETFHARECTCYMHSTSASTISTSAMTITSTQPITTTELITTTMPTTTREMITVTQKISPIPITGEKCTCHIPKATESITTTSTTITTKTTTTTTTPEPITAETITTTEPTTTTEMTTTTEKISPTLNTPGECTCHIPNTATTDSTTTSTTTTPKPITTETTTTEQVSTTTTETTTTTEPSTTEPPSTETQIEYEEITEVSQRVTCSDSCTLPTTWETTSKGETRDFYKVLRDRYGDRVKLLRATTHWPLRFSKIESMRDYFMYGSHNEV